MLVNVKQLTVGLSNVIRRYIIDLYVAPIQQRLSYLDGVCGGSLPDVVRNAPEVQAVFYGAVTADAAHEDFVLLPGVKGHGIEIICGVVKDCDAGGGGEDGADIGKVVWPLKFDVYAF